MTHTFSVHADHPQLRRVDMRGLTSMEAEGLRQELMIAGYDNIRVLPTDKEVKPLPTPRFDNTFVFCVAFLLGSALTFLFVAVCHVH